MATIKSYTDLEQSKKLAEILPIESADMCYVIDYAESNKYGTDHFKLEVDTYGLKVQTRDNIPCWSLTALVSVIPQELFDGEYIINITEGIDNKWIITYDHFENRNHSYYGLSTGADNLVDACTDIIIKLKERNII